MIVVSSYRMCMIQTQFLYSIKDLSFIFLDKYDRFLIYDLFYNGCFLSSDQDNNYFLFILYINSVQTTNLLLDNKKLYQLN